jgi:hypothetical protein
MYKVVKMLIIKEYKKQKNDKEDLSEYKTYREFKLAMKGK